MYFSQMTEKIPAIYAESCRLFAIICWLQGFFLNYFVENLLPLIRTPGMHYTFPHFG